MVTYLFLCRSTLPASLPLLLQCLYCFCIAFLLSFAHYLLVRSLVVFLFFFVIFFLLFYYFIYSSVARLLIFCCFTYYSAIVVAASIVYHFLVVHTEWHSRVFRLCVFDCHISMMDYAVIQLPTHTHSCVENMHPRIIFLFLSFSIFNDLSNALKSFYSQRVNF